MIDIVNPFGLPRRYTGLSSDKKSTAFVPNGSYFYELDTGLKYMFSREDQLWYIKTDGIPGTVDGLCVIQFTAPPTTMANTDYVCTLSTDDIDGARSNGAAVMAVTPSGDLLQWADTGLFAHDYIAIEDEVAGLFRNELESSGSSYQETIVKPDGTSVTTTSYGYKYTEAIPITLPAPEEPGGSEET